MAIDGFFIKHLTTELENTLLNNRLEKIFQLNDNYFIFNFYFRKKRSHLAIKLSAPNASLFLVDSFDNTNLVTSNFLKIMKKELEGAILSKIMQYKNDRVIVFEFTINDFLDGKVTKRLVFELMGRHNNLILTKDNIIIDAFSKRFQENNRSIMSGLEFKYFPTNKVSLNNIDYENFITPTYLSKKYIGVSPLLSRYLFNNKINLFNVKLNPTKDLTTNKMYWFDLFDNSTNKKHFDSLSKMLNDVVLLPEVSVDKQRDFVLNQLSRLNKRNDVLNKEITKANNRLNDKTTGDVIYSSGLNLNEKVSSIKDFSGNIIKLNSTKSLNENAQNAYKSYQKAKRTINTVTNLLKELAIDKERLLEIEYFLTLDNPNMDEIEQDLSPFGYNVQKVNKRSKKQQPSEPLKLMYQDVLIYVGKNSRQNDLITHKLATKLDYWLHVQGAPGSHVVVKSSDPSNEVLEFAAMLAASHSKLKDSNHIPVSYTQIKNIKKIPGRPGSQVILTSYQSLTINVDNELINSVLAANKLNY